MPDKLSNNTVLKILAGIITVGGTVFLIQWISGFFTLKPAWNPGNSIDKSLFTCHVSGPPFLTGGALGPVSSIQSLLLCFLTGLFFLWLARKRKQLILPFWKKIQLL